MNAPAEPTSLRYSQAGRIATITLHRPDRLNAIDARMPGELEAAVERAASDDSVHVVVLQGAGRAFCAGYDLQIFAQAPGTNPGVQAMPWEPMLDFGLMHRFTRQFMSLWRSPKPSIAKVHGYAVAGGSDIALCCDLVVMAEDAKIGYPPARVWGCPTTAMWAYRVGPVHAKRMLLTGDLIDGREAHRIGLVNEIAPADELDAAVDRLAQRIAAVPRAQLAMHKLLVNQVCDAGGLPNTQLLATLFDGMARHNPPGMAFKARAEQVGFRQAVAERDGGGPIPQHPDELERPAQGAGTVEGSSAGSQPQAKPSRNT
ncbi:MAG: crotonase/enoyl-CoA hydratase family protein [Myxococcales bacterium]|nr:crotonase/enoyl-CoA hydratase family protein [Myxococcales bacterium]